MRDLNYRGQHLLDRRSFLNDMRFGMSGIALAQLLQADRLLGADIRGDTARTPLRPAIDPANPNARARHTLPPKPRTSS